MKLKQARETAERALQSVRNSYPERLPDSVPGGEAAVLVERLRDALIDLVAASAPYEKLDAAQPGALVVATHAYFGVRHHIPAGTRGTIKRGPDTRGEYTVEFEGAAGSIRKTTGVKLDHIELLAQ